ncbi:unnamed protein product [Amoebophrya sp. A25]|nr:unnamed protein product [Amoebophrya sp. A25]|eukprot:GSA25T00008088001.1
MSGTSAGSGAIEDDGRPIPVNIPKFWGNEESFVADCIRTGWISSEGPQVAEFEKQFAKTVNRQHGIACCNGTAALDIAFHVVGLAEGDEVILPTLTIISCVNQVVKTRAKPVFVDSCSAASSPSSKSCSPYNLDLDAVEKAISEKTKVVLAVHIYEFPCDMERLRALVERASDKYGKKIYLIEDAAELIGGSFKGKPCGSFGDISTVSFYPNKHITTGEGGMLLTDDEAVAKKARMSRNLCFDPEKPRFIHADLGANYRMTCLQAALGLAQLENLEPAIKRKREIGHLYTELLVDATASDGIRDSGAKLVGENIRLPVAFDEHGSENIYWVYMIEILHPTLTFSAKDVMGALGKAKVGTRPCFYPLHMQPVFLDAESPYFQPQLTAEDAKAYPNAERLSAKSFYLPSGLGMTDADVHVITQRFVSVMKGLIQD